MPIKPTWISLKRKEPANNGSLTPRQESLTRAQERSLPKTPGPTNHAKQTTALIQETKAQQWTVPVVLRDQVSSKRVAMQYNNVTFSPRNLFLAAARERELGLLRHWRGRLEQQATKKTTRTATTTRHSHGGRPEHIHRNLDPDAAATLFQQLFCMLSSSSFSSGTQVCCCFFALLQLLLLSAISFFLCCLLKQLVSVCSSKKGIRQKAGVKKKTKKSH